MATRVVAGGSGQSDHASRGLISDQCGTQASDRQPSIRSLDQVRIHNLYAVASLSNKMRAYRVVHLSVTSDADARNK